MAQLEIETLSTNGEGIARVDGQVHFVPRTLPGECWEVEIVKSTKNWRRAHPRAALSTVPQRVEPACPHYDRCGGCQLQHLAYDHQLAAKRDWVAETLRRIGHIETAVEPVTASAPLGYRNKIALTVDHGRLCLHGWEGPDKLVPIDVCPQLEPRLSDAIKPVQAWLRGVSWLRAPLRRLTLMRIDEEIVMLLGLSEGFALGRTQPVQSPEGVAAVYAGHESGRGQVRCLTTPQGPPRFVNAFRQANTAMANLLYDAVCDIRAGGQRLAVDAYAGAGELTARLAGAYEQVIGIEPNPEAYHAAMLRFAEQGVQDRAEMRQGKAEVVLRRLPPADLVVLDPPRSGCEPAVLDRLAREHSPVVAYISCHPAALARDLRRLLDGGYRLTGVRPFDMFPQTHHVEVLALLNSGEA